MMIIQEMMGVRVVYFMAFIAMLFTWVAPSLESKWETEEPLLAYLIDSGEINQEMAEFLQLNCRLELIHAKEALRDNELCSSEEKTTASKRLISRRPSSPVEMSKSVNVFHPQIREILVDCLRQRSLIFPISEEEKDMKNWYTKYMGFLFARLNFSARRELIERFGREPTPALPVLSPYPAPPNLFSPNFHLSASPSVPPLFSPDLSDSGLQPTSGEHFPIVQQHALDVQSSKPNDGNTTVLIAVAVTALVTFIFSALLFVCCQRLCRTGIGGQRNDESPLLNLTLSDYSIASSPKSFVLRTSINEEELGYQSFNGKLNLSKVRSKLYKGLHSMSDTRIEIPVGTTAVATINSTEGSTQIPPGRNTTGLPVVNPPTRRTDSPELPAGMTASPPPPPAPVQPPIASIRPLSGEPCLALPGPPPSLPIPSGLPPPPTPPSPPPPSPIHYRSSPRPPPPLTPPPPPRRTSCPPTALLPAVPSGIETSPGSPPPPPLTILSSIKNGPCPPPPPPVPYGIKNGPHPLSPPPVPPGIENGPYSPPPPPMPPGIENGPHPPPPPRIPPGLEDDCHPPPPPPISPGIKNGPHPPPPPPIPSGIKTGRQPPPPPGGVPPSRLLPVGFKPPRAPPFGRQSNGDSGPPKVKLKPFFWDKVLANAADNSMVWHQIRSGSFQFNEEMIEILFGCPPVEKNKNEVKKDFSSKDSSAQLIQIIDSKKSQNLSILLKALNVTTKEVCDALKEGYELPSEFIQTLLKMAPTADEELSLRLYDGKLSQLGPADRFLKVIVEVPSAYTRLELLHFMCTLQEDKSMVKESLTVLEAACTELQKSRLFLKLLEAVLKTGNRMNDGTFRGGALAFKLDTLLKLSDVKGSDGKTTLLHFVVQEIIRSEGVRASRVAKENGSVYSIKSDDLFEDSSQDSDDLLRSIGLQVVSGLGSELENVKKAAILDADDLRVTVAKLGHAVTKAQDFLISEMKNVTEDDGFHQTLKSFVQSAEVDVQCLLEEEKRIMSLVKSTADYFHGKSGKDEGLRLFVIVRDFLIILDKVCKEVKIVPLKPRKTPSIASPTNLPLATTADPPRQRLFPAMRERRIDTSSSGEDSE